MWDGTHVGPHVLGISLHYDSHILPVLLYVKNTSNYKWVYWTLYFLTLSMTHVVINAQVCPPVSTFFGGHLTIWPCSPIS